MDLDTSPVHRDLDAKFKIGGLEALDLLLALIFGAVMNLIFGGTALEVPLAVGGPIAIILVMYFGKKGKPENYMAHLIKFYMEPGFFPAGESPLHINKLRKASYE
ncbi:MAG: hypothetical protein KDD22_00910 [Bdellovibrionales bacterium]|nr:hypothetical protein [Bdellovibrionales bacterium]